MSAEPLSRTETEHRLEPLPGWALEGDRITRTYRLPSHLAAAALTMHIARIQDELNHHSELTLGYNTVALAVHTHDAGGAVTEKDVELATRVTAAAPDHGAV
ncbi:MULTISPECIES: 4a-hydroxytetrahydrobiopterin dehydratase [Streptomyces]|uniref:Putative pterin-4-alpha-carbinolamine dehydratase n=1 Tax=Streptomyces rhizosphaericola TaxID=2564098 RepID=A0ABY2PE66_9ACTN|nr:MULTISPECIES: 4a-hydroxytetrahydrobiopterin dehydratase [Streptomyces]ARI51373.1 4a-hydroxytetrahydrobiopterin dehydratase [Streptomyces sp. S8]MYT96021.1 4a-hydroxytetrahydrobiopterin dehydratase [Streptomyces sp. SID8350]NGO86102.1 4a-hydroxytetrahydrobiopterin dehydratase [Streptomyces sp. 196(2019)]TGZ09196.1 4a-hydroxytetrahydrobiopterin dehydratase [Streptomyces rhizosphaericola]SCK45660.1 4a-hydroxytetrahydrobiopterin dehydratase [Streptomyces sp. AmelKG-D3]